MLVIMLLSTHRIGGVPVALRKQEGSNGRGFARNGAKVISGQFLDNARKCRVYSQASAILSNIFLLAHNLKGTGSNPVPATNLRRQVQDLAALSF